MKADPFDPTNPVHVKTQEISALESNLCKETLEALLTIFEDSEALTVMLNVKTNAVANLLIIATGNTRNTVIADQMKIDLLTAVQNVSEKYQSANKN